jgi:asparagine synthase (glutamine-hydrolysing)
MCGILGQVGELSDKIRQAHALATLTHRGPDAHDNWWSDADDAWLAQRRLAIVDLSEAGHQPMHNEDRTIWISCNGEIYNYPSLRHRLESLGHTFYSNCDVESIVHAYEEWGEDCVHHLEGMFAFAIWDTRKRKLILARDRVGIKPLAYRITEGGLTFASDTRAIIDLCQSRPSVNAQSVGYVLTLGYVPSPLSIWQDIHKLEAGHLLTWTADSGIQTRCYWQPPYEIDPNATLDIESWNDLFHTVLQEHLLSDVPLGMFLSGGLDSSSVALGLKHLDQSIEAITVSYPTSNRDESPFASMLSQHLGMKHTITPLVVDDVSLLVAQVAQAYDEPQSYSALLSMYQVCQVGAEKYKVILAGDGGDEVFGGYNWYNNFPKPKPRSFKRTIKNLLKGNYSRKPVDIWEQFARKSPLHRHASRLHPRFFPHEAQALLQPMGLTFTEDDMLAPLRKYYVDSLPLKRALQRVDLMTFCTDSILAKVDRASMAHSLEVRVPFLDRRVIEWGLTQPVLERESTESKPILRDYLRDNVPADILTHRKQGFSLRTLDDFNWEHAKQTIRDSQWVKQGYWSDVDSLFDVSTPYHTARIWNLYMLSHWANHWLS